jgi:hypothetical protein
MIEFKETDFNLIKVKRESKLFNLVTRYKYFVYGLRQSDNSPILIEYHYDNVDEHFGEKVEALVEFFKANGIEVEIYNRADNKGRVDVGLRRDLRAFVNKNRKPMLASSVISTIVYCLESRVDIDQLKKYKLALIPKLPKKVDNKQQNDGKRQNT